MTRPQVFDGISLSAEEYRRLCQLLVAVPAPEAVSRRRAPRVEVGAHVEAFVRVVQRDGTDLYYRVRARNISSGGLSFVHGAALVTGQACEVLLTNRRTREGMSVSGKIVRCRHVTGIIHDVAMEFTAALPGYQVDACAADAGKAREGEEGKKE